MAYPGEPEDFAYQQYVIQMQEDGQNFLPKDQWKLQQGQQNSRSPGIIQVITDALMRRKQ